MRKFFTLTAFVLSLSSSMYGASLDEKDWTLSGQASFTQEGILTSGDAQKEGEACATLNQKISLEKNKIYVLEWEFTVLKHGKWSQEIRLDNGPVVIQIQDTRAWLNIGARGLYGHKENRRYNGRCEFTRDHVISWKMNGYEQLKHPVAAWKKGEGPFELKLVDEATSGGKTLWHKAVVYEAKDQNLLKTRLLCIQETQRNEKSDFKVGLNLSTDKIPLEAAFYQGVFSGTIDLNAAKNEMASAQIAVFSENEDIIDAEVSVSDLVSDKETLRGAAQVYNVGYVYVDTPKITESEYGNYWPDALFPYRKMNIKRGFIQPYFLDIKIPPQAKANRYEAIVTVSSATQGTRSILLRINVRDFSIPTRNSLVTAFSLNPGALERCVNPEESKKIFGQNDRSATDSMYNQAPGGPLLGQKYWRALYARMLDYRLNPTSLYSDGRAGGFDFRVVPAMEDIDYCYQRGLNAVALACIRRLPEGKEAREAYFDKLRKHLKKWEDFAKKHPYRNFVWYIHGFDESEIFSQKYPNEREKLDSEIKETSAFLKKEFPWVKFETANGYVPRLQGAFDICTPRPFAFKDKIYQGYNKGDLWVYVACGPNKPFANFFIENPGADPISLLNNIFFTRPYIVGFLYYRLFVEIYAQDWDKVDKPFLHVPVQTKVLQVNGDGILSYPGPDGDLYFSTRMANLRDALEDYEVLKLLRQKYISLKKTAQTDRQKSILYQAGELLSRKDAPTQSWTVYSENGSDYLNYRKKIDHILEEMSHAF